MKIEDVDIFNKATMMALFNEAGISNERICDIAEHVKKQQREEAYNKLRLENWLTPEQFSTLRGYLEVYLAKPKIPQTVDIIKREKLNLEKSLAYSTLLSLEVVEIIKDSSLVDRLKEGSEEYIRTRKLYG